MYFLLGFLIAQAVKFALTGQGPGIGLGVLTGVLLALCVVRSTRFGLWLATVRGDETLAEWQRRMKTGA